MRGADTGRDRRGAGTPRSPGPDPPLGLSLVRPAHRRHEPGAQTARGLCRVHEGGACGLPALPQVVQQLPLAFGEVRARRATAGLSAQKGQRGRERLVLGDRAGRRPALGLHLFPLHPRRGGYAGVRGVMGVRGSVCRVERVAVGPAVRAAGRRCRRRALAGDTPGHAAGPHRGEGEGFGRGQPAGRGVRRQLDAEGAQLAQSGPDRQPGHQPEDRDHERPVHGVEAVRAECGRPVPQGVHAHREEQAQQRERDAPDALMARTACGDPETDTGQNGEERMGERGHHRTHEEGRRGHGGEPRAHHLVLTEGVAQIEDVLGEGETCRGEAGDDHAVDDPAEVPSPEEEEQQDGRRFGALLHDGRYDRGAQRVRAARVGRGGGDPPRREGIRDDRDQGRSAGTPGEGEQHVAPRARFDPVQPAERRHQHRNGQYGQAQTDEEPLRPRLVTDQGEDHQPAERQHGEDGDDTERPAPPQHADAARAVAPLTPVRRGSQDLADAMLLEHRDGRL